MSDISEVNNFLSRKAWIPTKKSVVKSKGRKPVPVKWVFDRKEEISGLLSLNLINLVKGYMQVPGVDFTDSIYPVASDTSTRTLIGLTVYYEDNGLIAELCDVEAAFLHPNTEFKMYIEWLEVIVDLGIISEEFLREYYILL